MASQKIVDITGGGNLRYGDLLYASRDAVDTAVLVDNAVSAFLASSDFARAMQTLILSEGNADIITGQFNAGQSRATTTPLPADGISLIVFEDFDPIIIVNDFVRIKHPQNAPAVPDDTQSILRQLSYNGIASDEGIRVGINALGNATVAFTQAQNTTLAIHPVSAASIQSILTYAAVKNAIEASTGDNRIPQSAFRGPAHTVFYGGAGTPPANFDEDAPAGSIIIRSSDGKAFYRTAAAEIVVPNRDRIRLTLAANDNGDIRFHLGDTGAAIENPDDIVGIFQRTDNEGGQNPARYWLWLRADALPHEISANPVLNQHGDSQANFKIFFQVGGEVVRRNSQDYAFYRYGSALIINGHNYLAYRTPRDTPAGSPALAVGNVAMEFATSPGNAVINLKPGTTSEPSVWAAVAGDGGSFAALAPSGGRDVNIQFGRLFVDTQFTLPSSATHPWMLINFGARTSTGDALQDSWQRVLTADLEGVDASGAGIAYTNGNSLSLKYAASTGTIYNMYIGRAAAGNILMASDSASNDAYPLRIMAGG